MAREPRALRQLPFHPVDCINDLLDGVGQIRVAKTRACSLPSRALVGSGRGMRAISFSNSPHSMLRAITPTMRHQPRIELLFIYLLIDQLVAVAHASNNLQDSMEQYLFINPIVRILYDCDFEIQFPYVSGQGSSSKAPSDGIAAQHYQRAHHPKHKRPTLIRNERHCRHNCAHGDDRDDR